MYVGILTYQHTTNFGAALQAYALRATCADLGARAEIVDYRSQSMAAAKRIALRAVNPTVAARARMLLRKPLANLKERAFDKFAQEHVVLSEHTFTDSSGLAGDLPPYDLILIGSDQVWNHEINGMDTSYFADFAPNGARIASYASSFGLTSIAEPLRQHYERGLARIDPISVRENAAARLIRELTGRDALVHADPVFLRTAEQWRSLAAQHPSKAVPGALVTYFIGSTGASGARLIASSELRAKRRVKLAGGLVLRDLFSSDVSVRIDRGPIDFLQAIDSASFVLADSFHATAMSIILDRPFGVLLKGDAGKDARILDILTRFGLLNRVVKSAKDLRFCVPSDDVPLEQVLDATRAEAYSYLKGVLCD